MFVGLHLTASALRAVWLRQGRDGEVRVERCASCPADGTLAAWAARQKMSRLPCTAALPGSVAVFRSIALAPGDPRTLEQAADMEVEISTEPDFQGMCRRIAGTECFPGTRQLILALARPDAVQHAIHPFVKSHIGLSGLIPSPVAAYYAMRRCITATTQPTLLLFMTADTTELVVGTATGILFMRSLATGTRSGAEALGAAVSVLGIYRKTFPQIAEGFLAAPEPDATRLAADMAERLRIPVTANASPPVAHEHLLAYGLALAGNDPAAQALSFLPPAVQAQTRRRACKPYCVAAALAGVLALLALLSHGLLAIQRGKHAVKDETRRLVRLGALDATLRSLHDETRLAQDRDDALLPMLWFPSAVRDILSTLAESLHPDDALTSFSSAPRQALILEGITPHADMASVKTLIERLNASPRVAHAELSRSEAVAPGDLVGRPDAPLLSRFIILVSLKEP